MSQLSSLTDQYRGGSLNARHLLAGDREWVVCFSCPAKNGRSVRHPLRPNNAQHDYEDFLYRHPLESGHLCERVGPVAMERMVRREEKRRKRLHLSDHFLDNASVLEAFQAEQSMDLTGLNSLAASATAGWCSAWVDNSANLYLDILAEVVLATGGATGNNNAMYVYAATSSTTTDLPYNTNGITVTNSAATSATMAFATIVSNPTGFPLIKVIATPISTKPVNSGLFAAAPAFGGWVGRFLWWPFVNYSGWAIAASSNKFLFRGIYSTIA